MRGISHRNYAMRGKSRGKLSHARALAFTNSSPNTIDLFFCPFSRLLLIFALPSVISSARFPRARCLCPQLASSASSDSGPEPAKYGWNHYCGSDLNWHCNGIRVSLTCNKEGGSTFWHWQVAGKRRLNLGCLSVTLSKAILPKCELITVIL